MDDLPFISGGGQVRGLFASSRSETKPLLPPFAVVRPCGSARGTEGGTGGGIITQLFKTNKWKC